MKTTTIALRTVFATVLSLGLIGAASARIPEAKFDQLQYGMTKDQVANIVGKPNRAMTYAGSGQTDWTYTNDSINYYYNTTVVNFDASGRFIHAYRLDTNSF